MAKTYVLKFGSVKASTYTGLSPTFTIFSWNGVTTITAPGVTESPAASGLYSFQYGASVPVIFEVDGGSSLDTSIRYLYGVLDPIQSVNEIVGTTTDSIGSTAVDPTTLMGYAKRGLEFNEGDSYYDKTAGTWSLYGRGATNGTVGTTLLVAKAIASNTSAVTKTHS